jgi:hypothetical protein
MKDDEKTISCTHTYGHKTITPLNLELAVQPAEPKIKEFTIWQRLILMLIAIPIQVCLIPIVLIIGLCWCIMSYVTLDFDTAEHYHILIVGWLLVIADTLEIVRSGRHEY